AGMKKYPNVLINVRVQGKPDIQHPAIQAAVIKAEAQLAGRGRVLLRASGTEPVLRVMVEGEDHGLVEQLAEMLAQEVRNNL
ncbi:MAG: phosphoglucosamine mutase, partial [Acinetobacter sp.]|nr:phosphoglucosamine mutase [Acinetobacter sp.]